MQQSYTADGFISLASSLRDSRPLAATFALSTSQQLLDSLYRDSWVVAAIVDSIAEDMTAAGIAFNGGEDLAPLQSYMDEVGFWDSITAALKWARLYGGALVYIDIAGQDPSTPLDPSTVAGGQLTALRVFDRYSANPVYYGGWENEPCYYRLEGTLTAHISRCMKFVGTLLPPKLYAQNNYWGDSVVQRVYSRILQRDNAITSAGRLVNRCFLRTVKVEGLRRVLAAGGVQQSNLVKMFTMMRDMQDSTGLTIMDTADEFQTDTFTFSGLSELLSSFDSDVAGACGIPMTRLYGTSAEGFSTGDSDLQSYYDRITRLQESMLRKPLTRALSVLYASCFNAPPPVLEFSFSSLWRPKDIDDRNCTVQEIGAIVNAANAGILTPDKALEALRAAGGPKELFSSITDSDIAAAAEVEKVEPLEEGDPLESELVSDPLESELNA